MCDFDEYQAPEGTVEESEVCALGPEGWYCTRDKGHEGPCAAEPLLGPSHISTEDVRHCIEGICTCDERAKLARPTWAPGVIVPAEQTLPRGLKQAIKSLALVLEYDGFNNLIKALAKDVVSEWIKMRDDQ